MNNTELKTAAENLHKVRVMRRGAGLEQFYNMWRTATRDPEFLRTGYYFTKGIFKVGTVIDLDLADMVVYHGGIEWNVVRTNNGFKLPGSETYFAAV